MCLAGVDYFSTLGYQPGLALIAAGAIAPIATGVLILVTLLGVVPVYRRVAELSPHGLGSIALVDRYLHGWMGKFAVLILLGFAATDFMITITLSAADASAHVLHSTESPWQMPVTLLLIGALSAVFFRGFTEAVSVAVVLVLSFLSVNAVVVGYGIFLMIQRGLFDDVWTKALSTHPGHPWMLLALALLVFPKLALGLSGFETGVTVMPLIRPIRDTVAEAKKLTAQHTGDDEADEDLEPTPAAMAKANQDERIRLGKRLMLCSASIMSTFLICSSMVSVALIPPEAYAPGGGADGRALAWIAHKELGSTFGSVYDIATVAILWFAGASAMAGMLALIPKFLPGLGMAPEWARRSRPMVGVLTVVAVSLTLVFKADVDAQAGAYATGVLVLLTSGGVGVALSAWKDRGTWKTRSFIGFTAVTAVLVYTLVDNVTSRPDGLRVAAFFIAVIMIASLTSRAFRAFELRGSAVNFDEKAQHIIQAAAAGSTTIALVPHSELQGDDPDAFARKESRIRQAYRLGDRSLVFVMVTVRNPSTFAEDLKITGCSIGGVPTLKVQAPAVPNAVAAIALAVRNRTGIVPDVYFEWAPGSLMKDLIRFLAIGRGQIATVTREILRRAEPDEERRPAIHVS